MSVYVNALGAVAGTTVLRRGSSGAAVRALQQMLIKMGFKISADGQFGPATEAAVLVTQRRTRQSTPIVADGVVGPQTLAWIEAESARGISPFEGSMLEADRKNAQANPAAWKAAAAAEFEKKMNRLASGTKRSDFMAAHRADAAAKAAAIQAARATPGAPSSASRAAPSSVMDGAKSKLPWVIGGFAILGAGALLLRKRK